MKKIMVVGSPGSGKSYISRRISEKLNIPVFHVDRLYWRENWEHVTFEELEKEFDDINKNNDSWIIDGNYIHTFEYRVKLCDTIVFLDIDAEICVSQEKERRNKKRPDFPDFLTEGEDPEFVVYIRKFPIEQKPLLEEIISRYNRNVIILHNREEEEDFINNL